MPVEEESYYKKHRDSYEAYRKRSSGLRCSFLSKIPKRRNGFISRKTRGYISKC